MSKDHLRLMANYNIWATDKLVQQLESMPVKALQQDCGLFFNSIFGTLNHLLLGEHYIWYPRFAEGVSPALALNQIVETDPTVLLQALREKSNKWVDFIEQLDATTLAGCLSYTTTAGQHLSLPYAATLMHVFNHGTHHRGQVSAAITAMGYDCPELDMVYMLREQMH